MSLIFFRNNKPDTRMIEYDRAVVELGLKKARMESEIENKRKELDQLSISRNLIFDEISNEKNKLNKEQKEVVDSKVKIFSDYEQKILDKQKEFSELKDKLFYTESKIREDKELSDNLDINIKKLEKNKVLIEQDIVSLINTRNLSETMVELVKNELRRFDGKKNELLEDLKEFGDSKIKMENERADAYRELQELNEIISVLQANNKEGLDVVSSFEGYKQRLQEKEESLKRREKDLLLYEKRVEKRAEELGINIKMTFK